MNGPSNLASIEALKGQAKRLRVDFASRGNSISLSESLEELAHRHGYKDWNTLHAATGKQPKPVPVVRGQRVSGHYLTQPFNGEVIRVENLAETGMYRVSLEFDEPVDVVTFESFSTLRRRVSCSIGTDGMTMEKTSNGKPQLRLNVQDR